jgi:hypothetical protein
MTATYRPTQDQDPQGPGQQQDRREPSATPRLPESIQRRVVVRSPAALPPGVRFSGQESQGQNPSTMQRQVVEQFPTAALPLSPPLARTRTQAIEQLRTAPGAGYMAYTASPAEIVQQRPRQEVENGNIILYRTHNFFLRTSFRPGQRQNPLRKPTGTTSVMPRVMPNQEKRIASSETRLMPSVTVNTTRQTRAIPLPPWAEAIMVVIALMGILVAHAYNMFSFPRFELDEGTYMANAWAITQGMISPYPYGYGHPPVSCSQPAI